MGVGTKRVWQKQYLFWLGADCQPAFKRLPNIHRLDASQPHSLTQRFFVISALMPNYPLYLILSSSKLSVCFVLFGLVSSVLVALPLLGFHSLCYIQSGRFQFDTRPTRECTISPVRATVCIAVSWSGTEQPSRLGTNDLVHCERSWYWLTNTATKSGDSESDCVLLIIWIVALVFVQPSQATEAPSNFPS